MKTSDSMGIPEGSSVEIPSKVIENFAKVQTGKGIFLTKSQKRKFKKLENDKKKKQLLSKSVGILEKCKVHEGVYKLLCSTRNIGQAETSKEKRRRIMQFSQAGFEVPYTDHRPTKIKFSDDISSTSETNDEAHLPQVYEDESNVLKASIEEISEEHVQPIGVTVGALSASSSSRSLKEDSAAMDEVPKDEFGSTTSVGNHSVVQGALSAPTVVHVSRPVEVESKRKDLPIVMMEQEIMEAVNENTSVIICGETGCGKTTQVPQFLYEAGFGSKLCSARSGIIGVTQPRRVAVLSTAKRVAFELGLRLGKEVGFQVRYDKRIGDNCAIKFMTDGILLREAKGDFLLNRYSVIILDEAHERSLNTDILIGMLSKAVTLRQALYEEQKQNGEPVTFPLKLILMSATFRAEDFTVGGRIFPKPPPVINVTSREYPVAVHFSKRTEMVDYIGKAYKKVMSIHKNLPPGGILVFVTGQREVEYLCSMLRKASKYLVQKSSSKSDGNEVSLGTNLNKIDGYDMDEIKEAGDEESDFSYHSDESESDLKFEADDDDDLAQALRRNGSLETLKAAFSALGGNTATTKPEPSQCEKRGDSDKLVVGPMCVFRLYGMLPAAEQLLVFGSVKEGERRVVVATNVAETSLTIPGIRYIVDTGREKVKEYNPSTGIDSFQIKWISQSSADQRKGRAGRTGPGHCYRLYSSEVFKGFCKFSSPEISKASLDGVVLLLKSMGIPVANFPFPPPPNDASLVEADASLVEGKRCLKASLEEAERCLKALKALDEKGMVTSLGKSMSQYPMNPRHSRMLLTAIQAMNKNSDCVRSNVVLGYAVAVAAALSLSNPFVFQLQGSSDSQEEDERKKLKEALRLGRAKFYNTKSDALTVAYALQCFELSKNRSEFCANYALHLKTMQEMSNLRSQLLHLVFQEEFICSDVTLQKVEDAWKVPFKNGDEKNKNPLSQIEEDLLLRAICAGWVDRVAKLINSRTNQFPEVGKNVVSYQRANKVEQRVYLHRGSSLSKSAPAFLVYNELLLHTESRRTYIHAASTVEPEWLVEYATSSSAPLTHPKPGYDSLPDQVYRYVTRYFGPHHWALPYHKEPIRDDVDRVRVFAYALLDGQVLPCLKSVRKFMAAQPSVVLKRESMGERRVGNFLSNLSCCRSGSIDNCVKLQEAWRENPMELYQEIRCWFEVGFHCHFDELWENMRLEALSSPHE